MSQERKNYRADPPKNILSEKEILIRISKFLKRAKKPVIAIVGPTASGKTSFSIAIAKKFSGEVINADSRQFYCGMDIGTAKITTKEMNGVPHHLFNFLHSQEECSVAVFKKMAEEEIKKILSQKKLPLLVGGSGLFVDAIRKNFKIPSVPPQKKWRESQLAFSSEELYQKLIKIDFASAKKMEKENRNRILRALEVFEVTGKKISDLQKQRRPLFDILLIGVWRDPEELKDTIIKRTDIIWNSGFLKEVQALTEAGCTEETPAMIAHGYREAMQFLAKKITKDEAKKQMTRNTHRYAKRQRTWWRREPEMLWVHPYS